MCHAMCLVEVGVLASMRRAEMSPASSQGLGLAPRLGPWTVLLMTPAFPSAAYLHPDWGWGDSRCLRLEATDASWLTGLAR